MKATQHESLPDGRVALAKMMTMHWIGEHGKQILSAALTIAIVLFLLFFLGKRFMGSDRSDYLKADAAFSTWVAQEKHDPGLFKQLSDPLVRYPELGAKFGTLIAQRLLTLGETKLAHEYAQAALARTKALLSPCHSLFSQNTLIISQGKFKEALEAAYHLKSIMAEDSALWANDKYPLRSGRVLYAYNLIRIASLEREAGTKEGEIAAWEEVMRCAGWGARPPHPKTYDPEAFKTISQNFQSGEVSLWEYIQQRTKILIGPLA
jgi:hypothetical protein